MTPELVYTFGHFKLLPERRALLGSGAPLKLGGRAFDVLLALVEHHDRVLSRDSLLKMAWPRLVVEEGNLNVQILMLRKLLGHPAIATVPGRGYRFALPVLREGGDPAQLAPPSEVAPAAPRALDAAKRSTNLPPCVSELFGRREDLAAIRSLIETQRLVTIAGAAGIGKTRVGQAIATQALPAFEGGAWWVELAPISHAALVVPAISNVLGVSPGINGDQTQAVLAHLHHRHLLLVLDNCEHMLEAVARFAEALWASAPRVTLLVTSQEPLKTASEQVYRLGTLTLPAASEGHSVAALAASGAGALFLARARAVDRRFDIEPGNVSAVTEICRRLDGIPLAIELAAARLPLLGIEGLRAKLSQRFNVLTGGARAVLRRHQTLHAALDWSHSLLLPAEQAVFRRIGVFAGGFTLEAAQQVAHDDAIDEWDVLEHLGALVEKSLVLAEGEPLPRYKLLESTRLFALEQLGRANETEVSLRRHAEAIVAHIRTWEEGRHGLLSPVPDGTVLVAEAENIRVALEWFDQLPRDEGEMDQLGVELGGLAGHALRHASGYTEAFDRTLASKGRVNAATPRDLAAKYWLMLAFCGSVAGRAESYDAAIRAAALYRQLGDDQRRYVALTCQVAAGARLGAGAEIEACVIEARGIDNEQWPVRVRSNFLWACYRWLSSQGRIEEALEAARGRARVARDAGWLWHEQFVLGDLVADCEIALGHPDRAEALCREALVMLERERVGASDIAHVLDTLAVALVMQGKHQEAIEVGRQALRHSRYDGYHFRLLEPMALNAAHQGRLGDAAWAAGHVDALYASIGEVRWPVPAARRAQLDALLARDLRPESLVALKSKGAAADLGVAFERVFGDAGDWQAQA